MIASATKKPLGEILVQAGVISRADLEAALEQQQSQGHQKLLGELLVELKLCSEEQIVEALATAYGVPYARINPKLVDPAAMSKLPKDFIERNLVLPLFCVEGVLTVAVAEPANVFLLEEIEQTSGLAVQLVASSAANITATLQAYLPNDKIFVIDDIIENVDPADFSFVEQKVEDIANLEQLAGDSPVIKLVNYLIYTAVKEGASDIHIEPGDQVLRVRFRLDGHLIERLRPPHRFTAAVASRLKIMAALDISERRLPQDGGIHVMMDKRPIDLRVSTMPGKFGEKVVIRVIDNERINLNLETLGFSYETLKQWRKLIQSPNGIILVTGPTGSGKSTTLYAGLAEINRPDVNICTIEDPVENNLEGINQFQVNEKAGFTFATALRALLRQDPDILMVGEVRDLETAKLATQAALTGHLVFSTLHTNDAPGAVTRLYNFGIEPYLVGATTVGVLAQRLVRKLCLNCREEAEPTLKQRQQLEKVTDSVAKVWKSKGCIRCRNTGFSGRVGIYELFTPDDRCFEAITRGCSLNELRELARQSGMRSLREDGIIKVAQGATTLEEVLRVAA
jgi:type IV pilus assembly protein PilB